MIDAQAREAPTTFEALIVGEDADDSQADGKAAPVSEKFSCPLSSEGSRGLTHGEVIDNAFLVLLAG